MGDKQNPGSDKDDSSPAADEESRGQFESPPKSYYYDDATGYEIYHDTDEEAEDADEEGNKTTVC